jgi:hypothetical protein
LKMFFALSMILMAPLGNTVPTSPEQTHPSSEKASFVLSGFLKYPLKILRPVNYTSPLGGLSVERYPNSGQSLRRILIDGMTPPTVPGVLSSG